MRNNVWIQNSIFASISGDTIKASVSGNVIYIGNVDDNRIASEVSFFDDSPGVGNVGLVTASFLRALEPVSNQYTRIRASVMISGQGPRLVCTISGDTIKLPNDGINNVVKISGQVTYDYGTSVVTAPIVSCAGTSGGTTMPSQACIRARVRSASGNTPMFVGGIGSQAPFSGKGEFLYGGDRLDIATNNFNTIAVFATTPGQLVSIGGEL